MHKTSDRLERLEELDVTENITTYIQYTKVGNPPCLLTKNTENLRLCVDYKTTGNKLLVNNNFLMPDILTLHMRIITKICLKYAARTQKDKSIVKQSIFGIATLSGSISSIPGAILKNQIVISIFLDAVLVQQTVKNI